MSKKFDKNAYKKAVASIMEKKTLGIVSNVVKNDVVPDLQYSVHRMIKEEVYDSYTPKQYRRRGTTGGLLDPNHTIVEYNDCSVKIRNTTSPAPSLFGTPFTNNPMLIDWMDEGSIARLPRVRFQPWIKDRKEIKKRIIHDVIIDGELTSKIADGLRRELKVNVKIK